MSNERGAPGDEPATKRLAERMRELRRQRRWSLERLALASGVSRSMLSQIERSEASPTLGVAHSIARSFGLSVGDLVDDAALGASMHYTASTDETVVLREDARILVRALTPLRYVGDLEVYELHLAPEGELRSGPHPLGTRETVVMKSGRATVEAGAERINLDPGDSASYRADVPHVIANNAETDCELILIDSYGSGAGSARIGRLAVP